MLFSNLAARLSCVAFYGSVHIAESNLFNLLKSSDSVSYPGGAGKLLFSSVCFEGCPICTDAPLEDRTNVHKLYSFGKVYTFCSGLSPRWACRNLPVLFY